MISMEPMFCATDDATYTIIQKWFGRNVSDKLLYDGEKEVPVDDRRD
jgi:hypothetical protein